MSQVNDDLRVKGRLQADAIDLPANSVVNATVSSGSPLDTTKVDHQHVPVGSQVHGSAAVNERRVIHVAHGDGTVADFVAGIVVAAVGAASVTVDLRKNGASILNAAISITNANTAYQKVVATFSSTAYVVGDVFEVVIVATAGGGTLPQGLFWKALFREKVGA